MTAAILEALRAMRRRRTACSPTPEELRTYECDALTNMRAVPVAVVLPPSTEQVQAVVRICHRSGFRSSRAGPAPG